MNAVTGNLVARQLLISPESLTAANAVETVPERMRPTMAFFRDISNDEASPQWTPAEIASRKTERPQWRAVGSRLLRSMLEADPQHGRPALPLR